MRTLKLMWKLWIKPLFCKHDYHFVRNLHGDEVRWHGWKRSVWRCSKCDKVRYENWYVAYKKRTRNDDISDYYCNPRSAWSTADWVHCLSF